MAERIDELFREDFWGGVWSSEDARRAKENGGVEDRNVDYETLGYLVIVLTKDGVEPKRERNYMKILARKIGMPKAKLSEILREERVMGDPIEVEALRN